MVIREVLELRTAFETLPEELEEATDCTDTMEEAVGDGGCGLGSIASWPMATSIAVVTGEVGSGVASFLGDVWESLAAGLAFARPNGDGGGGALPFLTKCYGGEFKSVCIT